MRILSVGGCNLDHIGMVERFPRPDFEAEMSKFSVQGGGCAATAVVALARWGVETKFVGKVGGDTRGDLIEMTLADEGVDTDDMVREPEAISQFRFILVESETARKKKVYTRGSVSPLSSGEVDASVLDGVDILLVDGEHKDVQLSLMQRANERDKTVIFAANSRRREAEELVSRADYLVASERFASQFAGVGRLERLCPALLEYGPRGVVVTMGDEGVVGMHADEGKMIREQPHPVDVVDDTGAGDVFAGAFAYGLTEQWDFERTIAFANKAGALACTDVGSRSPIASIDEIEGA